MSGPIWNRIDQELSRRKKKHLSPSDWAALGKTIGASRAVLSNWKNRDADVPRDWHEDIAAVFDWSLDKIAGRAEVLHVKPLGVADTIPNLVSLSSLEHSLLEDLRELLPDDQERFARDVRQRAEQMRKHTTMVLERAGVKTAGPLIKG
jgi:hypothetical protein